VVDQADDVQHSLMLRLLFFTAVRVSELCNIEVTDVDLENCKIRIDQGKGSKDRYVLFGKSFATALRTHVAAHPKNRWLFQSQRNGRYSTRRAQQIVSKYAEQAGIKATPHTFRHQAITWLTRHSGLADAELQLITGHARRETLAVYQHIAFDEKLEERYQEAMKEVEL
jgi:site-specific recombinase XerD